MKCLWYKSHDWLSYSNSKWVVATNKEEAQKSPICGVPSRDGSTGRAVGRQGLVLSSAYGTLE